VGFIDQHTIGTPVHDGGFDLDRPSHVVDGHFCTVQSRFGAFDVPRTVLGRRAARLLGGADVHEAKGHAAGDGLVHRPGGGVNCGLGAVDANNHRL
jgi:hypothetical protein